MFLSFSQPQFLHLYRGMTSGTRCCCSKSSLPCVQLARPACGPERAGQGGEWGEAAPSLLRAPSQHHPCPWTPSRFTSAAPCWPPESSFPAPSPGKVERGDVSRPSSAHLPRPGPQDLPEAVSGPQETGAGARGLDRVAVHLRGPGSALATPAPARQSGGRLVPEEETVVLSLAFG